MSDLHGMYEKYMKMLERISLSDDDDLYILGDVVDRGARPAEILLDMMERPNVHAVIGNHELMALATLDLMFGGSSLAGQSVSIEDMMYDWISNGGAFTIESIAALSHSQRLDVIDYMSEFSNFETAEVGGNIFIMVHAGFDNFSPDRKLSSYSAEELVWHRPDVSERYFEDESIFVVAGHTPTYFINGTNDIINEQGNILIDCGACFEGGRLACLRLDDMQVFYE